MSERQNHSVTLINPMEATGGSNEETIVSVEPNGQQEQSHSAIGDLIKIGKSGDTYHRGDGTKNGGRFLSDHEFGLIEYHADVIRDGLAARNDMLAGSETNEDEELHSDSGATSVENPGLVVGNMSDQEVESYELPLSDDEVRQKRLRIIDSGVSPLATGNMSNEEVAHYDVPLGAEELAEKRLRIIDSGVSPLATGNMSDQEVNDYRLAPDPRGISEKRAQIVDSLRPNRLAAMAAEEAAFAAAQDASRGDRLAAMAAEEAAFAASNTPEALDEPAVAAPAEQEGVSEVEASPESNTDVAQEQSRSWWGRAKDAMLMAEVRTTTALGGVIHKLAKRRAQKEGETDEAYEKRKKRDGRVAALGVAAVGAAVIGWQIYSRSKGMDGSTSATGSHPQGVSGIEDDIAVRKQAIRLQTPPLDTPYEFSDAARSIDPGEGWNQTMGEMGIPKEHYADVLRAAGPKLEKLGEAYFDQSANEWRVSSPGNLSNRALNVIASAAKDDGFDFAA